MSVHPDAHVAVVGGGPAGLTAAIFAARAGCRVTLLESMSELGGRARTRDDAGFRFNMGPHALYRNGPAEAVLQEVGVFPRGSTPPLRGALGWCEGRLHLLPGGPLSLLTTSLLGAREKMILGAMMARLPKLDASAWDGRSLQDFLETTFDRLRLRETFAALVRLSTYAHAPEAISAGAAIRQVQHALSAGVRYLDGGWQAMIDSLAECARGAGVEIRAGARVRAVEERPRPRVVLREGGSVEADAVVLALGPDEARALVDGGSDPWLASRAERSLPVRAACLDIGLSRLPNPKGCFALGIDEPTYVSLHSSARGVAPEGGALLQLARYLAPDEKPDRAEIEAQLDGQLDVLQPGWRDCLRVRKLLLDVRVAHAVPTAEMGGLAGRPRVDALQESHPSLVLAGDWIGPEGLLVDASFASGRDAGRLAASLARGGVHG